MREEVLRIRQGHDLVWREVEDDVIVLDVRSSCYLGVEGSGVLLWRALAEGATRARLRELLVGAFDVDEAVASRDVDTFVDALLARGLLERLGA